MKYEGKAGITLIALVITIIILLILAGISIAMLTGSNGLLTKSLKAKEEHLMSGYKEELNLITMEEVAERTTENKTEPMIVSLEKKVKEKDWVSKEKVKQYNEEGITDEKPEKNKYLFVESKEGYEFIIEVDNENETAKIIEVNKTPREEYTITYHPNGGTGERIEKKIKAGFSVQLDSCSYSKDKFKFVGWCEKNNPDSETLRYSAGSKYPPLKGNVTLYAIWESTVATVTFDSNDGTGRTQTLEIPKGKDTKLPENSIEREGYELVAWNTNPDGSGTPYKEGDIINITEDITLYTIWKETKILAKDVLKINPTATEATIKSPYVKYNEMLCRVLYNDETHGIQIITVNNVADVYVGNKDTMVSASGFTYNGTASITNDFKKAAASYNNIVDNLNNKAKSYMDTKGIATDARCLGSLATLTSSSKFETDKAGLFSGSQNYLTTYSWNNKFKQGDTNYLDDVNQINSLGLNVSSGYTWLASRELLERPAWTQGKLRWIYFNGTLNDYSLWFAYDDGSVNYGVEYARGFRPIFLLPADVVIKDGKGSFEEPYIID